MTEPNAASAGPTVGRGMLAANGTAPPQPRIRWRDLGAGALVTLGSMPAWLALGLVCFASLGAEGPAIGLPAACVTVAAGGVVTALLGRSAMPAAGMSIATVLMFAALVAQLAADPQLAAAPGARPALLLAVMAACVVATGLLQMLFGLLRLGSLVAHVPQPVLAGFMNGVAVMLLLGQIPSLLGLSAAEWQHGPALSQLHGAPLLLGAVSAGSVWLLAWRWPKAPGALVGLALGCALYAALSQAMPGLALGRVVGSVPSALPGPDALRPLLADGTLLAGLLARHGHAWALTAGLIAVVAALETVLNTLAVDEVVQTRHDPNRELLAFGAANVASGLFGGLPVVYWRARAGALLRLGAGSRHAVTVAALGTGALYLLAGEGIARLPMAVLGGLLVTTAVSLLDRWTLRALAGLLRGERSRERLQSLALMAVVFALTLWQGLLAGVLLGVALALALFVHAMNRSLVRGAWRGSERPSRRQYPQRQAELLRDARERIAGLDLEGALFFGNADALADRIDALDAGARFVVLDLRRISTIDASGALALAQIARRLARRQRRLLLAGVTPEGRRGRTLRDSGAFDEALARACFFADTDQAVDHAEHALLAEAGLAQDDAAQALAGCTLLQGLGDAQRERVTALLQPRELAAGERLFAQGDPGDRLYVLTRGSVTVLSSGSAGADEGASHRYLSFAPGMMFGETAMLDGRGRTADAVADMPSTVHALPRAALDALAEEDPALAQRLVLNIAVHLSERLRQAAADWRAAMR